MRIRGVLLIVCALCALAAADTPQKEADRLFTEGRALLAADKPAEACAKFEAAIKLDPTATGTMLNLGLCYENLKKYATSIRWFRKAQVAAAENQLHEYEKAAKEHTTAITGLVNTIRISITGASEAEIRVDGERVEPTEYGRYEVDPGRHAVEARTAGMKTVRQGFEVPELQPPAPGQPSDPNLPLEVSVAFTEKAVPVYVDRGAGRRRGAIILGSVGLAAMAFSGVYTYVEKGNFDDVKATDNEKAKEIKTRVRFLGTGAFILGAAAVATSAYLYYGAAGKEQVSDGTAFAPVISHDRIGVAVSGSF